MSEADSVNKTSVFNFLIQNGCCRRCGLRFVGGLDASAEDVIKEPPSDSSGNAYDEQIFKRLKLNPCVVCLDLLQETTLETMVANPVVAKVSEYDCDTFVNYISFPKSVLIREHGMELCMKEEFPQLPEDHYIVPLNRAWSLSIQNKLAGRLQKSFDKNSPLQVQFNTEYEFEKEESSIMSHLEDKLKKVNGNSNAHPDSRNNIRESLKNINSDIFRKFVSVPPQAPTKSLHLQDITFKHDPIFIAGRYCKYARNIFQTPWIDEEVTVTGNSVQEIIFQSLDNVFNCHSMVFSSSGREDFDVRTLGRGRPFFIKICDPKITKVPSEKFRSIEAVIKETKIVKVRDLQLIERKYLNNIKEGEQFKQKTYRALCIVDAPEKLDTYIEKINSLDKVTLQQKTPLRVFHRRSADVRKREIYSLKATPIAGKNNLFELVMVTQAGTYVKEFVHGDLGRTTPSLSEIIDGKVDIITLDVLDIHLDFPPSLG